jgi:hypothetical protein
VAQLYTLALGSLFVAPYESQGYGGAIRPSLEINSLHVTGSCYLTLGRTDEENIFILVSIEMFVDRPYPRKRGPVTGCFQESISRKRV